MNRRHIKVKYVGFWEGFDENDNFFSDILNEQYIVETSEEPDYIICSCFGNFYEYCQYPQIRIMYCGENYIPDFNLIDYAICRFPITFLDRTFFYPGWMNPITHFRDIEKRERHFTKEELKEKVFFANFISSHESEFGIRGSFYKKLSEYKRIESAGTYLNNMPENFVVDYRNESKTELQRKSKFTLCFESTKNEGFITEKITDAFYADTIPIYYGSSTIVDAFNPEAFLDYSSFENEKKLIDRIIELDNDDDKYLEMLNKPIFLKKISVDKHMDSMRDFLFNIFEQPYEDAYRRSRCYYPKYHNDYLNEVSTKWRRKHDSKIYKAIKRILK